MTRTTRFAAPSRAYRRPKRTPSSVRVDHFARPGRLDPDLQRAHQPRGRVVELRRALLAAQGALDHLRAESLLIGQPDPRSAALDPFEPQQATVLGTAQAPAQR